MRVLPLFLLFSSVLFSLSEPPLQEVDLHNRALAPSLVHFTSNIGAVPESQPSIENPIIFFDLKVLTALPSVDSRISDNRVPEILFGWGESHAREVEEEHRGDERCPPNTIKVEEYGEPIPHDFFAVITFRNSTKTLPLGDGSQNIFQIPFTKEELSANPEVDNETNMSKPLLLNVSVSGRIDFPYLRTERSYFYVCEQTCNESGCTETCRCDSTYRTQPLNFTQTQISEKTFLLENGNVSFFLLRPILREQLERDSVFDTIIFSKRLPYKFHTYIDGKIYNASYEYEFQISKDPYGIEYINSRKINRTGFSENDSDMQETIPLDSSLSLLHSERFLAPFQILPHNESFSHLYLLNTSYAGVSGRHEFSILFFDHFNEKYAFSVNLSTRKISSLFIEDGKIKLRDEDGNPLPNKNLKIKTERGERIVSTDANGEAEAEGREVEVVFEGDEFYRGASASSSVRTFWTLDFSVFGSLLVPLAILLGLAYRKRMFF